MKAAKKFFTRVALTMIAILKFITGTNPETFMKAYNEGIKFYYTTKQ
jgi:hypothetical protein